jgi:hypothetical protein
MLFRSFVALMILTEWGARIAIKCHWLSATQNSPREVCTLHLGFVSGLTPLHSSIPKELLRCKSELSDCHMISFQDS